MMGFKASQQDQRNRHPDQRPAHGRDAVKHTKSVKWNLMNGRPALRGERCRKSNVVSPLERGHRLKMRQTTTFGAVESGRMRPLRFISLRNALLRPFDTPGIACKKDVLSAGRRRGMPDEDACSQYGVSAAMLRFRFNVTGVDVQMRRARGLRRGRR